MSFVDEILLGPHHELGKFRGLRFANHKVLSKLQYCSYVFRQYLYDACGKLTRAIGTIIRIEYERRIIKLKATQFCSKCYWPRGGNRS
jgi:hypothetical protein